MIENIRKTIDFVIERPSLGMAGSGTSFLAGLKMTIDPTWIEFADTLGGIILMAIGIVGGVLGIMIQLWSWKHRRRMLQKRSKLP